MARVSPTYRRLPSRTSSGSIGLGSWSTAETITAGNSSPLDAWMVIEPHPGPRERSHAAVGVGLVRDPAWPFTVVVPPLQGMYNRSP